MKLIFAALLTICISAQGFSQNNCSCCSNEYRQFDFWLGEWNVYDTLGKKVGENTIVLLQDSCLIQENWVSPNSTGTSYNYYDRKTASWNQLWVDNSGGTLNLKGKYVNGQMVLKSQQQQGKEGNMFYHKIVWKQLNGGNISQIWTIIDDSDTILKTLFNGIYKKKPQ